MFLGHYMGGVMYAVTHLIMGPPILGRVPSVRNSLLDKVSVAGQGESIVVRNHKKQSSKWVRVVAGDVPHFSEQAKTCWARKTNSHSSHPRSNSPLESNL